MSVSSPDENTKSNNNSGYALLVIDDLKLLIPQQQIKSLEMVEDMESTEAADAIVGHLEFEDRFNPVFCFSAGLTILNPAPSSRRVCILLQADSGFFGILCDRAELLTGEVIHPQPFPECMATADSPLQSLAIFDDEITTITSTEMLAELLPIKPADETTDVVDYV